MILVFRSSFFRLFLANWCLHNFSVYVDGRINVREESFAFRVPVWHLKSVGRRVWGWAGVNRPTSVNWGKGGHTGTHTDQRPITTPRTSLFPSLVGSSDYLSTLRTTDDGNGWSPLDQSEVLPHHHPGSRLSLGLIFDFTIQW